MKDVYTERSYGRHCIGFGERPGIVVVDYQTAFTDPTYPLGGAPLIERGVVNTARVLELARRSGVPVASCYTAYRSERDMPYWKVGAVREQFLHGHPCTALDPRIHDPDYDVVPEDCVGDHDQEPHDGNLRDVGRRYCDVSSSEEVLDWLETWRRRNA